MVKLQNEVRTLDEQMSEYFERKEKIEQLKKELLVNPKWDIYYDEEEDEYLIKDFYGQVYPINIKLREMLPKSYFFSPEADEEIVGYNAKTGSVTYDLWRLGKNQMLMREAIYSDFHDTGYGIGDLLTSIEKYGFGDKVPPTLILPSDFVDYHQNLQGSMYVWGYDVSLINDIGWKEHRRLDLEREIESEKKHIEEYGDIWTADVRDRQIKHLEYLAQQLNDLEKAALEWDARQA